MLRKKYKLIEKKIFSFQKAFLVFLILSLFFVSILEAKESSFQSSNQTRGISSSKKGKKRVSSITFEDELIQGDVKNPYVSYFSKEGDLKHKKIIKLRNNFLKEMKETAELWPHSGK